LAVRLIIRRLGLGGSGIIFGVIALASVVMPQATAQNYAFAVESPDAYNQFHAVFTGFWAGLSIWMITAARRPRERLLGDLAGIAIGLQALARLLSIFAHGKPSGQFVSAMIGEMVTCVAILQGGPATGDQKGS
jgi:peptidoglycan/LPS O-acetylase OafA/YrhL